MSKRFYDTATFSQPWFRKLPPRLKALFWWLNCACDCAGVLAIDWQVASLQIGEEVSETDVPALNGLLQHLHGDRYWLTTFVDFQYGPLSTSNPAHRGVMKILDRLNLPYATAAEGPTKPLGRGLVAPKDTDTDKEKKGWEGVGGKDRQAQTEFDQFWSAYPRRKNRKAALAAWEKAANRPKIEVILAALAIQKSSDAWQEADGKYVPGAVKWIENERWTDQPTAGEQKELKATAEMKAATAELSQPAKQWILQAQHLTDLQFNVIPAFYSSTNDILADPEQPFSPWFRVLFPDCVDERLLDLYGNRAWDELAANPELQAYAAKRAPANLEQLQSKYGTGDSMEGRG